MHKHVQRIQFVVVIVAAISFISIIWGANTSVENTLAPITTKVQISEQSSTDATIPIPTKEVGPCAATPTEAVQELFRNDVVQSQHLRIRGERAWSEGAIVLYNTSSPNENGTRLDETLNYTLVEKQSCGWQPTHYTHGFGAVLEPSPFIASTDVQTNLYTIVFGWTLSSQVKAVEVVFSSGETHRDTVTDGVFAVLAAQGSAACELRALSIDNAMLERIDFTASNTVVPCPNK